MNLRRWSELAVCLFAIFFLVHCGNPKPNPVEEFRQMASSLPRPQFNACDRGLTAFKTNVHPVLRKQCIGCHDVGGIGPAHSIDEAQKSYGRILAYVSFKDISASRMITKIERTHWFEHPAPPGGHPTLTTSEMKAILQKWWDEGQKDCPDIGKYVTKPSGIPKTLPFPCGNMSPAVPACAKMEWKLKTINPAWEDVNFEMEVIPWNANTGGSYYLLRRPRLTSPKTVLKIGNLKILLNGKTDPMANNFSLIEATVGPAGNNPLLGSGPLLSVSSILVPNEDPKTDELSLTFEILEESTAKLDCKMMDLFKKDVLPVLEARNCYVCHGGGPNNEPGRDKLAVERLPMKQSDQGLCHSMLQRANGKMLTDSPLLTFPLGRVAGHPQSVTGPNEILPYWLDWVKKERS